MRACAYHTTAHAHNANSQLHGAVVKFMMKKQTELVRIPKSRSGSSSEGVSFGPELKESGVEGVVGTWWVVPREVSVYLENVLPHLPLSLLRNGSQNPLQVFHLCPHIQTHTFTFCLQLLLV